jgi:hypothetical protein
MTFAQITRYHDSVARPHTDPERPNSGDAESRTSPDSWVLLGNDSAGRYRTDRARLQVILDAKHGSVHLPPQLEIEHHRLVRRRTDRPRWGKHRRRTVLTWPVRSQLTGHASTPAHDAAPSRRRRHGPRNAVARSVRRRSNLRYRGRSRIFRMLRSILSFANFPCASVRSQLADRSLTVHQAWLPVSPHQTAESTCAERCAAAPDPSPPVVRNSGEAQRFTRRDGSRCRRCISCYGVDTWHTNTSCRTAERMVS